MADLHRRFGEGLIELASSETSVQRRILPACCSEEGRIPPPTVLEVSLRYGAPLWLVEPAVIAEQDKDAKGHVVGDKIRKARTAVIKKVL